MIGKAIRSARKKAGISQEELASRAGIHATYVSQLERDVKSPTVNVLVRICDALDVRASDLIREIEKSRR